MLVALKLFCRDKLESNPSIVTLVPAFTDNRGNGAALNKLMSTKFPSSAILMELSTFLKEKKIKALVEWTPRESNREADLLANGITSDFNPSLEMKLDPLKPDWLVLPQVLDAGRQAEAAFMAAKQQGLPNRARKEKRRRLEDRLRMKDPW